MSNVTQTPRGSAAAPTLLEALLQHPALFGLDAAMAVLMRAAGRADVADAVRFHATTGLGFVGSDIAAISKDEARFRITTGMLGLTGPSGVLPRPYSELVSGERRRRSPALSAFLDLLAQRPLAQFVQAGIKYRPHRAAEMAAIARGANTVAPVDGLRTALLALVGYGTPGLAGRLATGEAPLLYHAATFAARPRSASRLGAMLSDWLQQPVEVQQFAGHWITLDPSQRTALPGRQAGGQFNRLGRDAAIGTRSWDIQSRIVLRTGPLTLREFEALMPGGRVLSRLMALAQAYLDGETECLIQPVLAAAEVPPLRLGRAPRLGWNCWLPSAGRRLCHAADALFGASHANTQAA